MQAFSNRVSEGYSLVAARGRLTVVVSPVAECGFQGVQASVVVTWGLISCTAKA